MIISDENIALAFKGFSTVYNTAFEAAEIFHPKMAMEIMSSASEETYGWLGQFPQMREWLGERLINQLSENAFTIRNKKFESTVEVRRQDIEDDRYGIYKPMFAEMGRAARQHPDRLMFDLLASGFTSLGYDGQAFFDADHPVTDENGAVVSVSNVQTGSGPAWYLLDASRAIKPIIWQVRVPYEFQTVTAPGDAHVFMKDSYLYGIRARVNAGLGLWQLAYGSKAALTPTNYAAARAAMQGVKGDRGLLLGIRPTHLVVPPALEAAGRELLTATSGASGSSNIWHQSAELVVAPYLA